VKITVIKTKLSYRRNKALDCKCLLVSVYWYCVL